MLLRQQAFLLAKISDCCRSIRNTAGGYHWYYIDDYIKKDGTIIPGAITLGLIAKTDMEEAEELIVEGEKL